MNFLKGLALYLLSFLLFLSVTVFGIAFMIQSTVLDADFITGEVDKIDISSLARELTEEELIRQLPREFGFMKDPLYNTLSDLEPELDEQLNAVIYSFHDFLSGESGSLSFTISLELLIEDMRDNLHAAFLEEVSSDLTKLPEEQVEAFIDRNYREILEQVPDKYLPPEIALLPDDLKKTYLLEHYQELIGQISAEDLTPELTALIDEQVRQYFDRFYDEFIGQLPAEVVFDESDIPQEVMAQLISARQYIGYFQTGYYALIAFMVLLVIGIVLISRDIRSITRMLGINFMTYGVLEYAGIRIINYFIPAQLPLSEIPSALQMWVMGLFSDVLAPLEIFSLGLLAGGVVLVIASFFIKTRAAEE